MKKSVWVVYCSNQMEWFDCKKDAEKFVESANESGHEASEPLSMLIPVIMPNELDMVLESLEYARDGSYNASRSARTEAERTSLQQTSTLAERAIQYARAYWNDMWMTGAKSTESAKKQ